MDELEIGVFLNWGDEEYVVFRLFCLGESEKGEWKLVKTEYGNLLQNKRKNERRG